MHELAHLLGEIAAGQVKDGPDNRDTRDRGAVALGRKGGIKGGKARGEKLPSKCDLREVELRLRRAGKSPQVKMLLCGA